MREWIFIILASLLFSWTLIIDGCTRSDSNRKYSKNFLKGISIHEELTSDKNNRVYLTIKDNFQKYSKNKDYNLTIALKIYQEVEMPEYDPPNLLDLTTNHHRYEGYHFSIDINPYQFKYYSMIKNDKHEFRIQYLKGIEILPYNPTSNKTTDTNYVSHLNYEGNIYFTRHYSDLLITFNIRPLNGNHGDLGLTSMIKEVMPNLNQSKAFFDTSRNTLILKNYFYKR